MNIEQPRWKKPEYTQRQVNDAGNVIRNPGAAKIETLEAINVIDNWRAAHAYLLQVFYMNLRRRAGSRDDIIVAQRLKRLDSIVGKLKREKGMQLSRMQDLGGCRFVVPTIKEVYSYSFKLQLSRIRHEFKRKYDYIAEPKKSGYRSLHLVYKFQSDTPGKEEYNKNMLIELQFRTHLQHIWATALETMGLFTQQALKAGQGSEDIKRFFVLVSSLFAIKEECPIVPGTVGDERELISEIEQINDQIHVLDILKGISVAINHQSEYHKDKRGYYILTLNYINKTIRIGYYKPSETEKANKEYNSIEESSIGKPIDSVLVRASSVNAVRAAYPNYFLDIGEFGARLFAIKFSQSGELPYW